MKNQNSDQKPKEAGSKEYIVTIPLLSLATNDGTADVMPSVGDSIDIQATGVVKSVDGDFAKIAIQTLNGNSVSESAETPSEPPPGDTGTNLRAAAQTEDEANYY